jgi:glycosyltransferase involved in cell wall biosynthesis
VRVLVDACTLDGLPSGAATRLAGLGAALSARGRVEVLHLVRPGLDPLPGLSCLPFDGFATPWQRLRAGPRLARVIAAQQAALFQAAALPLPRLSAAPLLLTLHDLRFLDPASGASPLRRLWGRHGLRSNLARAARIVAVSRTTADALRARASCPEERLSVVPNAGTPGLARIGDASALAAFRRAAGLNARYALVLGPIERHKQPGFLLSVLARLRGGPAADLVLAFAGRADPAAVQALQRRAAALQLESRVAVLGLLDGPLLAAALSGADALLLAGRSEGFSIPLVDAQRLEVPVVAVSAGALPEVAGDGAWFAPSGDEPAFAAALQAALTPGAERSARLAVARRAAERWSWERSAEQLEQVWLEVAGR